MASHAGALLKDSMPLYWLGDTPYPSDVEGAQKRPTTETGQPKSGEMPHSNCPATGEGAEDRHGVHADNGQKPKDLDDKSVLARDIFPQESIDVQAHIPPGLQKPRIPEGVTELTVVGDEYTTETYGKYKGQKKAVIRFRTEGGQIVIQTYYLSQANPNFAKLVVKMLGKVPEGEFFLKSLRGKRVGAFLYHNYMADGRVYANIATCWPIEE